MEDRTTPNWLIFINTLRNNKTDPKLDYADKHKISETESFRRIIEKITPSI